MFIPKVYISILNWNSVEDTLECIESVLNVDYDNYNIVVLDNASSDNSVEILRNRYPSIFIIENKVNAGFSGGNNKVIEYAINNSADYIWLLNSDAVVERNSLRGLVEHGESSNSIGMISPIIYYYSERNKIQFCGSKVNWENLEIEYPDLCSKISSEYMSGSNVCLWGTALLIKSALIKKIGKLRDEYFAYWEDTEYSLRVIKSGYRNVVDSTIHVYHKSPISKTAHLSRKKHYYYYMVRNKLLMLQEYGSIKNRYKYLWKEFAKLISLVGALRRVYVMDCAEAAIDGFLHGYKNVSGPMKESGPSFFKSIIFYLSGKHPHFISNILLGNYRSLYDQICQKISIKNH